MNKVIKESNILVPRFTSLQIMIKFVYANK